MARPAPSDLPIMPIGCWAVPLALVGALFVSKNSGEPDWWMLVLGVLFSLFTLAYLDRAATARRRARREAMRAALKRALFAAASAALFFALYFIGQ
ncbi:hypothetical protein [Sphingomicrobium arenosum]|uniref:hypothetical protein n=1 Tax=Sphingomicrobium arenosum TaxID=2233861 RepID=UPI00223FDB37|nr:hypothetical protein [Sphingomicrobium arenosum]